MVRGFLVMTTVGFLLVSGYGCGIKARGYVAERERVDQANTGNAGFVKGDGTSMAGRPTRKVYVLEFERQKKDPKKKPAAQPAAASNETGTAVPTVSDTAMASSEPAPEPMTAEQIAAAASLPAEYTVEKDDTLQKIAKKFYNSYSKWTKIYDANKDKIKNPNFVKPGTVLTIPAAE
jgi:nucleoid-associated protein YgaU